jgi:hypothetical protein
VDRRRYGEGGRRVVTLGNVGDAGRWPAPGQREER